MFKRRPDYFDLKEFKQVTIVLFLLHANIARYFYFLVTKGNLALLFFTRDLNSIRANESLPLVPTRCLLSLVSNGTYIHTFI